MLLYIDPGTGSMLFTILIGVLGALIYILRGSLVKLRFLLSGGKVKQAGQERVPYVFFTDSKRYYSIFKPLCDEMERRGETVMYLTMSPDDPMLSESYAHVTAEFIGEGNKGFARMNMLQADVVLSSTPGLDVYQWKRSRDALWYVHIPHAANDLTLYRMFGLDYYDAVLVSGEYETRQVRQLEELRQLPEKEVCLTGLPQLDGMLKRREQSAQIQPETSGEVTVLLAPSWGPNSIFNRYGSKVLDALLSTEYHIIVRPHPQSYTSEKEMLDELMQKYPASERLEWNRSTDNFDTLSRSHILISDFSGVIFDYCLVFERPVIYADVSFDVDLYDAWWIRDKYGDDPWTLTILKKIGMQLTQDNCEQIGELIDHCLHSSKFRKGIQEAREEAWANIGSSVPKTADYLISAREHLLEEKQKDNKQKDKSKKTKDRKGKDQQDNGQKGNGQQDLSRKDQNEDSKQKVKADNENVG